MSTTDYPTAGHTGYVVFGVFCVLVGLSPQAGAMLILVGIAFAVGGLYCLLSDSIKQSRGRWRLDATKEGAPPYMELFDTKHGREVRARQLRRKGYEVTFSINTRQERSSGRVVRLLKD